MSTLSLQYDEISSAGCKCWYFATSLALKLELIIIREACNHSVRQFGSRAKMFRWGCLLAAPRIAEKKGKKKKSASTMGVVSTVAAAAAIPSCEDTIQAYLNSQHTLALAWGTDFEMRLLSKFFDGKIGYYIIHDGGIFEGPIHSYDHNESHLEICIVLHFNHLGARMRPDLQNNSPDHWNLISFLSKDISNRLSTNGGRTKRNEKHSVKGYFFTHEYIPGTPKCTALLTRCAAFVSRRTQLEHDRQQSLRVATNISWRINSLFPSYLDCGIHRLSAPPFIENTVQAAGLRRQISVAQSVVTSGEHAVTKARNMTKSRMSPISDKGSQKSNARLSLGVTVQNQILPAAEIGATVTAVGDSEMKQLIANGDILQPSTSAPRLRCRLRLSKGVAMSASTTIILPANTRSNTQLLHQNPPVAAVSKLDDIVPFPGLSSDLPASRPETVRRLQRLRCPTVISDAEPVLVNDIRLSLTPTSIIRVSADNSESGTKKKPKRRKSIARRKNTQSDVKMRQTDSTRKTLERLSQSSASRGVRLCSAAIHIARIRSTSASINDSQASHNRTKIEERATQALNSTQDDYLKKLQNEAAGQLSSLFKLHNHIHESNLSADLMTEAEFHQSQANKVFPAPVSHSIIQSVCERTRSAMEQMDMVCVVCSLFISDSTYVPCTSFSVFAKQLGAASISPPLDPKLIEYYDLSHYNPVLKGMLLSQDLRARAPHYNTGVLKSDGTPIIEDCVRVCKDCRSELGPDNKTPPVMSIANHNAIGELPPDLRDISWAEQAMVSLVHGRGRIVALHGGGQKALRGHVLTVQMAPGTVAKKLPRDPNDLTFRVVLASKLTDLQRQSSMKMHVVRAKVLRDTLNFFREHNPLYKIEMNEKVLKQLNENDSLIDLQQQLPLNHPMLKDLIKSEPAVHNQGVAGVMQDSDRESILTLRQSSTISTDVLGVGMRADPSLSGGEHLYQDDMFQEQVRVLKPMVEQSLKASAELNATLGGVESDPRLSLTSVTMPPAPLSHGAFMAVRSGDFVPAHSVSYRMQYPTRFPYARGDLNEKRRKPLSKERHIQRLLRLSTGQFHDSTCVLGLYNSYALYKAAETAFIKVQLHSTSFRGLMPSEVIQLMNYQQACSSASRAGRILPDPPANLSSVASKLFRSMHAVAGKMPHSDDYAKRFGRPRVFSMWYCQGPPTLMITLNPNDLASFELMYYARGGATRDRKRAPSAQERSICLAEEPGAAALAFHRLIHIFIRHFIGYDLDRHTATKQGGVFGHPTALFGAVEEQNRGSLHLHLLLWISGADPLPLRVFSDYQPGEFNQRLADLLQLQHAMGLYTSSIMTAKVKLPEEFVQCPHAAKHEATKLSNVLAQMSNAELEFQAKSQIALECAPKPAATAKFNTDPGHRSQPGLESRTYVPMHISQVEPSKLNVFRVPQVNRVDERTKEKLLAPLSVCTLTSQPQTPFDSHEVLMNSLRYARRKCNMSYIHMSSKDAYNVLAYENGPIPYVCPPHLNSTFAEVQAYKKFCIDIASTQLAVMAHDPRHRQTCTKNGPGTECRFHFPFEKHIYQEGLDTKRKGPITFDWILNADGRIDDESISKLPRLNPVKLERDGLSAWQNQCNLAMTSMFRCNNDVKPVLSPGSAYYMTLYHVKSQNEETSHFREIFSALDKGLRRDVGIDPSITPGQYTNLDKQPLVNQNTSSLSLLLRMVRAETSTTSVGAMMSAYLASGFQRFICSEEFASLHVASAEGLVRGEHVSAIFLSNPPQSVEESEAGTVPVTQYQSAPAASESDPVAVAIKNSMSLHQEQTIPVQVHSQPSVFVVSSVQDYLFRPEAMAMLTAWEFTSLFTREPISKSKRKRKSDPTSDPGQDIMEPDQNVSVNSSSWPFRGDHPLFQTHRLRQYKRPRNPILHGDRLPDSRNLLNASKEYDELRQIYGLRAFLMFVPHRSDELTCSVLNLRERAWLAWQNAQSMIDQRSDSQAFGSPERTHGIELRRIRVLMQYYHLASSDEPDNDPLVHEVKRNDPDPQNHDGIDSHLAEDEADDRVSEDRDVIQLLEQIGAFGRLPLPQFDPITGWINMWKKEQSDKSLNKNVSRFKQSNIESDAKAMYHSASAVSIQGGLKFGWIRKPNVEDQNLSLTESDEKQPVDAGTAAAAEWIREVGNAIGSTEEAHIDIPVEIAPLLKNLQNEMTCNVSSALGVIIHVIQKFKLNVKQHQAFLLIARQLFRKHFNVDIGDAPSHSASLRKSDSDPQMLHSRLNKKSSYKTLTSPQLLMYVGGAAGTGKSLLIASIKHLYCLLSKRHHLMVCGMTGVAAILLNGVTLHSALGLTINNSKNTPTAALKENFDKLMITQIILDECSMMSTSLLEQVDRRLRFLRSKESQFGGISLLLVGDFCQLPPVNGTPLISNSRDISLGRILWVGGFTTVITLTQQMRQAEDPVFADHLQHLRNGTVGVGTIEYFNQRFRVAPPGIEGENLMIDGHLPRRDEIATVVVAVNADRLAINKMSLERLFEQYRSTHRGIPPQQSPFFRIQGVYDEIQARGSNANRTPMCLTEIHRQQLMTRGQSTMDHVLRMYIGMEVAITTNICVRLGIANGSRAIIRQVQMREVLNASSQLPLPDDDGSSMRSLSVGDIARLVVHLCETGGSANLSNAQLEPDLPPGHFSVFPMRERLTGKGAKLKNGVEYRSFALIQFPIVPVFAITCHKTQGLTMSRLILATHESKSARFLYVALSRVRSASSLQLLRRLPLDLDHECYKIKQDLTKELTRLSQTESIVIRHWGVLFAFIAGLLNNWMSDSARLNDLATAASINAAATPINLKTRLSNAVQRLPTPSHIYDPFASMSTPSDSDIYLRMPEHLQLEADVDFTQQQKASEIRRYEYHRAQNLLAQQTRQALRSLPPAAKSEMKAARKKKEDVEPDGRPSKQRTLTVASETLDGYFFQESSENVRHNLIQHDQNLSHAAAAAAASAGDSVTVSTKKKQKKRQFQDLVDEETPVRESKRRKCKFIDDVAVDEDDDSEDEEDEEDEADLNSDAENEDGFIVEDHDSLPASMDVSD